MKQFLKVATWVFLSGAFLPFFACDKKLPVVVIPYTPSSFTVDITTPTVGGTNPAGTKVFAKDAIDNAVATFLKGKNIAVASITAIDITELSAEIQNSALDFGDVTSSTFNLGGADVATFSGGVTGKKVTYKVVKPNVLAILTADKTSYSLSLTTNKATPAATVLVTYTVNISYSL
jgi:hypothetical protein